MVQPLLTANQSLRKRAAVAPVELESGSRPVMRAEAVPGPVRRHDADAAARMLDLVDASVAPLARFFHYPAARRVLARTPSLTPGPLRAARVLAGLGAAATIAFTHGRVPLVLALVVAEVGLVFERAGSLVATRSDRRLDGAAAWAARLALVLAIATRAPADAPTTTLAALTLTLGVLAASTSAPLRQWVIRRGARGPSFGLRALATAVGLGSFDGAVSILHFGTLGALFAPALAVATAYLLVTWIATAVLAVVVICGERATAGRPAAAPSAST